MFDSLSSFQINPKALGSGTYGEVKLGRHISSLKSYALKIIK